MNLRANERVSIELEDDGVAQVRLIRADKMNALDADMFNFLVEAGQALQNMKGLRCVVLAGEGRAFCAGRDISAVTPADDDVMGYLGDKVTPLLKSMSAFPAPTFAAVQGACLGVGLGLAIATDVVYVAENAKIGSPFANLGATLDSGGHWLFTERLGTHRTLDLADECRALVEGLRSEGVLPGQEQVLDHIRRNLTEIGLTQSYQDLTGQIIRRVARIVRRVHEGFGELGLPPRSETGGPALAGPVVAGLDRHAVSQNDADALLSDLGL